LRMPRETTRYLLFGVLLLGNYRRFSYKYEEAP
jgi:hypothetical protein